MSCTTKVEEKSQLLCTFPQSVNGTGDLVVYFNPSSGNERRVVRCVMLEEFECTNEGGFRCTITDHHSAEITLPDSLKTERGSFRCQLSGLAKSEIKRCSWPSEEMDFFDGAVKTNATLSPHSLPDDVSVVGVSAAIGIVVAVIILVFISTVLYKKVYKKGPQGHGKCSMGGSSSCMEALKRLLCKWCIRTDNECNGLSSQAHEGTDARQTLLLSSNSEHNPHRENGYSKTKDDKTESKSVKINIDAGLCTTDENMRLECQT